MKDIIMIWITLNYIFLLVFGGLLQLSIDDEDNTKLEDITYFDILLFIFFLPDFITLFLVEYIIILPIKVIYKILNRKIIK